MIDTRHFQTAQTTVPQRGVAHRLRAGRLLARFKAGFKAWLLAKSRAWIMALLIGAAGLGLGTAARADVWQVTGQWDDAAEQRYSAWVERQFTDEFFYRNTPYEDIATDCADAAYGMRMVFAFENKLPFVIRDPANHGRLLSQATDRFDRLPAGLPRFRAFMDWVMINTGTGNLVDDTYPVSIDREQIRPGIIYLTWRVHAMQIVSLQRSGVIRYLESTAPRAIRPMRSMLGFPHQVPADPRAKRHGDGFRRFKWPQHYGLPEHRLPGYGTEQFEQARALERETLVYYEWVQSRLALEPEEPGPLARRTLFAICELTYDRASAIDEAQTLLADLRRSGRRCMNAAQADEHSTPIRDSLLSRSFDHLERLPQRPDWPSVQGRYRRFVDYMTGRLAASDQALVKTEFLDWCNVGKLDGGPGRPMDLLEVQELIRAKRLVSEPHAPPPERWGLAADTGTGSSEARVSARCRNH